MPTIESGETRQDNAIASSDVPVLPKAIACRETPQCPSFMAGQGCDHAMSRLEMVDWLAQMRGHRTSVETGASKRPTKSKESPTASAHRTLKSLEEDEI